MGNTVEFEIFLKNNFDEWKQFINILTILINSNHTNNSLLNILILKNGKWIIKQFRLRT